MKLEEYNICSMDIALLGSQNTSLGMELGTLFIVFKENIKTNIYYILKKAICCCLRIIF